MLEYFLVKGILVQGSLLTVKPQVCNAFSFSSKYCSLMYNKYWLF